MNYGYSPKSRPVLVHKTKTSIPFFGGEKKFLPECDKERRKSHQKGEISGYVMTGEELTVRCNKKGLKAKKCDRCFGMFDSW